jgi:hypothetical protein
MLGLHVLSTLALLSSLSGPQPTTMPFTTIARGEHSQIEQPKQVVVRTAAEWSALWKEHAGEAKAPLVDFAHAMVVAVFAGSRPTAGYGVEVTRIERQGGAVVVIYHEQAPKRGDIVAQVLTAPFHVVQTSSDSHAVKFEEAR